MNSRRPYLLRAIYEWICDNACTPYVLVDTRAQGLLVPDALRGDTRLVLNLGPSAVRNLLINGDGIMFDARFSGVSHEVFLPGAAVLAIYARENGEGMAFEDLADESAASPTSSAAKPGAGSGIGLASVPSGAGAESSNASDQGEQDDAPDPPDPPKPGGGSPPRLSVVK